MPVLSSKLGILRRSCENETMSIVSVLLQIYGHLPMYAPPNPRRQTSGSISASGNSFRGQREWKRRHNQARAWGCRNKVDRTRRPSSVSVSVFDDHIFPPTRSIDFCRRDLTRSPYRRIDIDKLGTDESSCLIERLGTSQLSCLGWICSEHVNLASANRALVGRPGHDTLAGRSTASP